MAGFELGNALLQQFVELFEAFLPRACKAAEVFYLSGANFAPKRFDARFPLIDIQPKRAMTCRIMA